MIYLDVGQKGSGKTYTATWEIYQWLKQGVNCWADWDIDYNRYIYSQLNSLWGKLTAKEKKIANWGKLYRFDKLPEVYNVSNGQIYVDEAYRHLNAREWEATPPQFISKMAQSRHWKTDLHFLCQYPNQVDNVVRKLADVVRVHYKYFFFLGYKEYPGNVVDKINDPDPEKPPKSDYVGFHLLNRKFAESYNSWSKDKDNFKDDIVLPPVWSPDLFSKWVTVLRQQKQLNKVKKVYVQSLNKK